MALSDAFLRHVRAAGDEPREHAALEQSIARALERAERAWPALRLDRGEFVAYVAERIPPTADPASALDRLHVDDLYLACGCAHGIAAAVAILDEHYLVPLRIRAGLATGIEDELRQAVRERLLVSRDAGAAPRIAGYTGRGPLVVWLRMCAVRLALNLRRHEKRHAGSDFDDDGLLPEMPALDPELRYLRSRHARELADAFRATIAELPDREVNLLRMHFLDGLSPVDLGRAYRVSPRTIQRWLAATRDAIRRGTRARLKAKLGLESREIESLLAPSRLDVTITGLLRRGTP